MIGQPRWLNDWKWNPHGSRPGDIAFKHVKDCGPGYEIHINDVPVFNCPQAGQATWVLGKEAFEKASFHRYTDDLTAEVAFEPDPDPWKGYLIVGLQYRAVRRPGPVWKIKHPTPVPGAAATT
jgi:hypothetical protein